MNPGAKRDPGPALTPPGLPGSAGAAATASVLDAAAGGALVLTPNRRLARELHRAFARRQSAAGRIVWESPRILPWDAWLAEQWGELAESRPGEAGTRLLGPAQTLLAWQEAIEGSDRVAPGAVGALARLASEAWALAQAWDPGDGGWRRAARTEEALRFLRWARRYEHRAKQAGWLDPARLPDRIARGLCEGMGARVDGAWLVGFLEISPQQSRLLAALGAAGATVRTVGLGRGEGAPCRLVAPDAAEELRLAATWARHQLAADPDRRCAIVVPDLEARRGEVLRVFDETFGVDAAVLPGEAARAFNLSLGQPLDAVDVVHAALLLLEASAGSLEPAAWGTLLRSSWIAGDAAEWRARHALEVELLRSLRPVRDLGELARLSAPRCPVFSAHVRALDRAVRAAPGRASPWHWRTLFEQWLRAAGWPREGPVDSHAWQAREAFAAALGEWASLGAVRPLLGRDEALRSLRTHVREQRFQPESREEPVQVLGLLEALGLPFDAVWVCGLTAEAWPPAPRPNPLLSLAWQRGAGVPRGSFVRERRYALAAMASLSAAAAEVVFSHPAREGEQVLEPSPLVRVLPVMPEERSRALGRARQAHALFAARQVEAWSDHAGRALAPGHARGGARLIEDQASCPFRAYAAHRLGADPWPAAAEALSASEHGIAVHRMLEALWLDLGGRDSLLGLGSDALDEAAERAMRKGIESIGHARWEDLPAAVRSSEERRLRSLLGAWLEVERRRPAFEVLARERRLEHTLAGLQLSLRVDRIDRLAHEGLAIVDYKTGKLAPGELLRTHLLAPQLPLYAQALAAAGEAVAGLVLAGLSVEGPELFGVLREPALWPEVRQPGARQLAGLAQRTDDPLPELMARWSVELEGLAAQFLAGRATVEPARGPETCRTCGRQALCRIHESLAPEGDEGGASTP